MTGARPPGQGPQNPDWTDDETARLLELWPTGLSTAKIGKEIGRSKHAVVSKVDRLGLPDRPSPIPQRPDPNSKVRKRLARGFVRRGQSTLPPLASEVSDAS